MNVSVQETLDKLSQNAATDVAKIVMEEKVPHEYLPALIKAWQAGACGGIDSMMQNMKAAVSND